MSSCTVANMADPLALDDILIHVISFLPFRERVKCTLVCRRWAAIVRSTPIDDDMHVHMANESFLKCTDTRQPPRNLRPEWAATLRFVTLGIEATTQDVTDEVCGTMLAISKHAHVLESLTVSISYAFFNQYSGQRVEFDHITFDLSSLAAATSLKKVMLYFTSAVPMLLLNTQQLSNLRVLRLFTTTIIDANMGLVALRGCPGLEELRVLVIDESYRFNSGTLSLDESLTTLTRLTKLEANGDFFPPNLSPWPLREIATHAPQDIRFVRTATCLRSLAVETVVDDETLTPVSDCSLLTCLKITAQLCGDVPSLRFLRKLHQLRQLDITNTACDDYYMDLSPITSCTQLKTLCLMKCTRVRDISPVSNCINLEKFYVDGGRINNLTPISACVKLRHFTLKGNRPRGESSVPVDIEWMCGLQDLKFVNVVGCSGMRESEMHLVREHVERKGGKMFLQVDSWDYFGNS